MELFLFRHAEAEPSTPETQDARRTLTLKGRERFARGVKGLENLEVELDRVYHSPWARAVESAELLAPILDGETVVTTLLARSPSQELLDILDGEHVGLVGHEPWLSELLGWLVLGVRANEPGSGGELFEFEKGGVAWLGGRPEPGAMTLRAF